MIKREAIRWRSRLATGSALALLLGAPALASAGDDQTPSPRSPEVSRCVQRCDDQNAPPPLSAVQQRAREADESDQAQAGYQLGASPASPAMPRQDHPYTQAHYQLGAGHED